MLHYRIEELPAFSVIGLEQELTNQKSQNLKRCLAFWPQFNQQLKLNRLNQANQNWTKFAFMERRENQLTYFCAIPCSNEIPANFILKEIPASSYLVVEHLGSIDRIYSIYEELYQKLIPSLDVSLAQTAFLHFEKYDQRFYWKRADSVIEIWVPIRIEK